MRPTLYYVHYGSVWAVPWNRAYWLARKAAAGEGYNLDDYGKQLARRYCGHGEPCECRTRDRHYKCLDWSPEDWRDHIAELDSLRIQYRIAQTGGGR